MDEASIRAAFETHGSELFRLALRHLGDRTIAGEVVQESFVRAWRESDSTTHLCRERLFSVARGLLADTPNHHEPATAKMLSEIPEDRHDVLMKVRLGASCTEIATGIGVPVDVLRSRMYDALKSLQLVTEASNPSGMEPPRREPS